jgi:hypothetical protein
MASTVIAQIFYYYSEYSLLICKPCKKAIVPRDAIGHFKTHLSGNQPELSHWLEIISTLDIQSIRKSHEIIRECEPIPPLSALNQLDGYICTWPSCQEIKTSKTTIFRHFQSHGQSHEQAEQWVQPYKMQSLTRGGYLFRIELPSTTLPVLPSAPPQSRPATSTTPSTRQSQAAPQQWAQGILEDYQARIQALEENSGSIKVYYSKAEWSTFHSTVGTANFWQGRDIGIIGPLLGDNLPKQRAILQLALFYLFRKAEIRVPFLPRQSRANLRSFDQQNLTFREFRTVQQQATREKYITVMARFIQFLLATFQYQVRYLLFISHFSLTFLSLSYFYAYAYFHIHLYVYLYAYIYAYVMLTFIPILCLYYTYTMPILCLHYAHFYAYFSYFSHFSLTFLSLSYFYTYAYFHLYIYFYAYIYAYVMLTFIPILCPYYAYIMLIFMLILCSL